LQLLHRIFEANARTRPRDIAVIFGREIITYGELDARANQFARHLRGLGARRRAIVAMLMPRSIDACVSILGILKAGAAYLPIDPACPAERIAWMVENSGACAMVTDADLRSAAGQSSQAFPADSDSADADDLCYVIYTSGSTGRPKGVMVEHRNARHLVQAERQIFGVRRHDRVYQGAPLSFDLSVEEIWLAFAAGATLVAATPDMLCAGPDLPNELAASGVTVLSCVPTLLSLLDAAVPLPSLRLLILGGENCSDELIARWRQPGRRVFNTYGPTETTVIATYADVSAATHITIGRPLPGYRIAILDDQLRPVSDGAVGEICIAGEGVARGYIGLPAETQDRFVRGSDGARMYRSGDLARLNPEGNFEFAGRMDGQVKLRGLRVELGEIEAALLRDDNVRAAACVLSENSPGDPHLAGYVILKDAAQWDETRLRAHLGNWLPSWMVPAEIGAVADLPRLASGKLDRASLCPIPTGRRERAQAVAAPGNTEDLLMQVWTSLFCSRLVSVSDDFFLDLGGYSLLAARMVSELRRNERFATVTVRDVYRHSTISRLAGEIDSRGTPAEPTPREQPAKATRTRLAIAGMLQTAGLYFVFAFRGMQWIAPWLVFFLLERNHSAMQSALWAAATAITALPILILIAACAKWILLGRIGAGRHPLWGSYYLRWWLVHTLVRSLPLKRLGGTPLLPFVYRLFGAHIGSGVQIASDLIAAFDITSIGDGSSIDEGASLLGYHVTASHLEIKPVYVGRDCLVGTRSVLAPGAIMEDGARLEDLSLLACGAPIPANQTWTGSPAQERRASPADAAPQHRPRTIAITLLYSALILLFPLFELSAFVPGVALLERFSPGRPLFYLAATAAGASFIVCMALEVTLMKWLLIGRARAGKWPVHSWFYVRHWLVEQLLALSVETAGPLHSTIFLKPWYRALGAKLGRFVELSNVTTSSPDLLDIGDDCTIADEVSLGAARVERGWLTLAPVRLERRSFIGNGAVVPAGTVIGEGSLIGVLTVPPEDKRFASRKGASWLGSPPIFLARRQPATGRSEQSTFRPTRLRQWARGCFELLRISLPGAGFVIATVGVIDAVLSLWEPIGPAVTLCLFPAIYAFYCAVVILAVVPLKWLVVGRYQPFEKPCWSAFVWRLEFVNALFEFLASPIGLETLEGTPLLPWYLRLMGCRIGKGVYIETTGFLEFDLTEVGDRAMLNKACILQTHLFEDRVMKGSGLKVGADCEIGTDAIVLYDTEMKGGARLGPLSLVMKGEVLPAGRLWIGSPLSSSTETLEVARRDAVPVKSGAVKAG